MATNMIGYEKVRSYRTSKAEEIFEGLAAVASDALVDQMRTASFTDNTGEAGGHRLQGDVALYTHSNFKQSRTIYICINSVLFRYNISHISYYSPT